MFSLEISSVGSACGKNPYESRSKTLFTQLCKEDSLKYKQLLIEQGIIVKSESDSKEKEFQEIYKKFKSEITCPSSFEKLEEKILTEFKIKEPDADSQKFVDKLRSNMKKDCGINNEKTIIEKKSYKKGNNKLWLYKDSNCWELKGLHDASDGEVVIEVKTRMRKNTVRKNKYDLYQLFGYLLAMNKTKGKIVQMFNREIYDSDVETENEYGLVDITTGRYSDEFICFKKELNDFFREVLYYKDRIFDLNTVFGKLSCPIAEYSDNGVTSILTGYEKIVKLIF